MVQLLKVLALRVLGTWLRAELTMALFRIQTARSRWNSICDKIANNPTVLLQILRAMRYEVVTSQQSRWVLSRQCDAQPGPVTTRAD